MLENLYTTKMSTDKKKLQNRFTKIRSESGKAAKIMSFAMTAVIAATMLCVTVVMATFNEEEKFFINGKGYAITPICIESILETHTDSYYVPLRDTFEALGYEVLYDVDKSKYENLIGRFTFPQYASEEYSVRLDDEFGTEIIRKPPYYLKNFVKTDVERYVYGATNDFNRQMPIIEMTKGNETWACQIGSRQYDDFIPAGAVVLIEGRAYIPLRAVAYIVGGQDNVKWDNEKKDTYFEGALDFNEAENTVTINLK